MRAAMLLLGILLLLLLQAVEVWRRLREPEVLTRGQYWRRLLTAAALQVVLLMWLVGEPLTDRQPPLTRLAYWTGALLLAIGAAFAAVREMAEVSRQYNRQRAELFRREMESGPDSAPSPDHRGASAGNGLSG
jgi:hypothetical protein